jgi:ABC-type bacteriocin/lantibiotic exporter with double-glycine peptidase domain
VSRSTPPFYKQETRYSCAPACLRMVLSALGMDVEESHLRHLTDCTPLGTEAFQVIEAARHLGFPASRKYTFASLDELASVVADDFGSYTASLIHRAETDRVQFFAHR